MNNELKLLNIIKNVILDIEILEDQLTLKRVKAFLGMAVKTHPQRVKIFVPESLSKEQTNLIRKIGLAPKDAIVRPQSLYKRYSLIHKIFGKINPNWIECRQTLYLNYFQSDNPIHSPNEFKVYPTLKDVHDEKKSVPIICPLRQLRTCNIVRNCIHNCIYCYVPHTGAPKMPLVICVNMPEKVKEQIKRMKTPYIFTDFGSISDPCNPLIDNVFRVFTDTFSVLKEYNYPALILTKANPSHEILEALRYNNALLAFSLYHLDPNIKMRWELHTPSPYNILKSMEQARELGVRLALRIDVFPGYNDNVELLQKIVKQVAPYGVEHITAGSLRARPGILHQIKFLNPSGYKVIITSLDKIRYSDNAMRPHKNLRSIWYSALSHICKELKIPFSLCKEEPELITNFSSHSKCLCQWTTSI